MIGFPPRRGRAAHDAARGALRGAAARARADADRLPRRELPRPARLAEVVVKARDGATLTRTDRPVHERERRAARVPEGPAERPAATSRTATLAVDPGTTRGDPTPALRTGTVDRRRARGGRQRDRVRVADLARRPRAPASIALSLLIALFWGAAHALTPGHGKTIVAAYMVGSRGTACHALLLGLTVTFTHTIGVFALGLVTLGLS